VTILSHLTNLRAAPLTSNRPRVGSALAPKCR
jgi:hypothetical protein